MKPPVSVGIEGLSVKGGRVRKYEKMYQKGVGQHFPLPLPLIYKKYLLIHDKKHVGIEIKFYNLDTFKKQVDANCIYLDSEFVDLNCKVASLIFCHFWRSIHVFNKEQFIKGTQRLFSVKYLFGEANIAYHFLFLENGLKFLDDRSIHVQSSKLI